MYLLYDLTWITTKELHKLQSKKALKSVFWYWRSLFYSYMHHGSEPQIYSHGVMLGKEQPPSSTIHTCMTEIWNNRFLELVWQKLGSAFMYVLLCRPIVTKMELSSAPDTNMSGQRVGCWDTHAQIQPPFPMLALYFHFSKNVPIHPQILRCLCSSAQWLAPWQTLPVSPTEVVPVQLWAAVH